MWSNAVRLAFAEPLAAVSTSHMLLCSSSIGLPVCAITVLLDLHFVGTKRRWRSILLLPICCGKMNGCDTRRQLVHDVLQYGHQPRHSLLIKFRVLQMAANGVEHG